jgi:hypothetical protein
MMETLGQAGVELASDFAFAVQLVLKKAMWPKAPLTAGGKRVFVGIESGTIAGPLLNGIVVPDSGGDYAHERPDGVIDFDARYMLQADDGTNIFLQSRGYRWASEDAMVRMRAQQPVAAHEYYMRVITRFECETGPHDWLNKHVFVGIGDKIPYGNIIRYFRIL